MLRFFPLINVAISQLSHVYLAQYGQYFPRFSNFAVISNKSAKYEQLGKYWSYCTWNHAITNAYCPLIKLIFVDLPKSKTILFENGPKRITDELIGYQILLWKGPQHVLWNFFLIEWVIEIYHFAEMNFRWYHFWWNSCFWDKSTTFMLFFNPRK